MNLFRRRNQTVDPKQTSETTGEASIPKSFTLTPNPAAAFELHNDPTYPTVAAATNLAALANNAPVANSPAPATTERTSVAMEQTPLAEAVQSVPMIHQTAPVPASNGESGLPLPSVSQVKAAASLEPESVGINATSRPKRLGADVKPVISVRNVKKVYQMGDIEVSALRSINLDIFPGEIMAIMGPSGSGKSTLMNVLGCLDVPSDGTYLLDGVDVRKLSDNQLATIRSRKIGFVFQSYNLLARTTALANVELPLLYSGTAGRERRKRAKESLTLVGLGDRFDHRPNELSGGQQQRVAIARALINSPSMILADEPTGNLDSKTRVEIMKLFQRLNRDQGITVIFVTHDPETAEYCERVVWIRDGVIARDDRHKIVAGIYAEANGTNGVAMTQNLPVQNMLSVTTPANNPPPALIEPAPSIPTVIVAKSVEEPMVEFPTL